MSDRTDSEAIVSYLLGGGVVAYQRALARAVGSHSAGLLLSQFWYWSEKLPEERDGWFYKTQDEIYDETVMTRWEQETARRKLRELGILEEAKRGVPAKLWFRIEEEADAPTDILVDEPFPEEASERLRRARKRKPDQRDNDAVHGTGEIVAA